LAYSRFESIDSAVHNVFAPPHVLLAANEGSVGASFVSAGNYTDAATPYRDGTLVIGSRHWDVRGALLKHSVHNNAQALPLEQSASLSTSHVRYASLSAGQLMMPPFFPFSTGFFAQTTTSAMHTPGRTLFR
jgi:hypothetical protein